MSDTGSMEGEGGGGFNDPVEVSDVESLSDTDSGVDRDTESYEWDQPQPNEDVLLGRGPRMNDNVGIPHYFPTQRNVDPHDDNPIYGSCEYDDPTVYCGCQKACTHEQLSTPHLESTIKLENISDSSLQTDLYTGTNMPFLPRPESPMSRDADPDYVNSHSNVDPHDKCTTYGSHERGISCGCQGACNHGQLSEYRKEPALPRSAVQIVELKYDNTPSRESTNKLEVCSLQTDSYTSSNMPLLPRADSPMSRDTDQDYVNVDLHNESYNSCEYDQSAVDACNIHGVSNHQQLPGDCHSPVLANLAIHIVGECKIKCEYNLPLLEPKLKTAEELSECRLLEEDSYTVTRPESPHSQVAGNQSVNTLSDVDSHDELSECRLLEEDSYTVTRPESPHSQVAGNQSVNTLSDVDSHDEHWSRECNQPSLDCDCQGACNHEQYGKRTFTYTPPQCDTKSTHQSDITLGQYIPVVKQEKPKYKSRIVLPEEQTYSCSDCTENANSDHDSFNSASDSRSNSVYINCENQKDSKKRWYQRLLPGKQKAKSKHTQKHSASLKQSERKSEQNHVKRDKKRKQTNKKHSKKPIKIDDNHNLESISSDTLSMISNTPPKSKRKSVKNQVFITYAMAQYDSVVNELVPLLRDWGLDVVYDLTRRDYEAEEFNKMLEDIPGWLINNCQKGCIIVCCSMEYRSECEQPEDVEDYQHGLNTRMIHKQLTSHFHYCSNLSNIVPLIVPGYNRSTIRNAVLPAYLHGTLYYEWPTTSRYNRECLYKRLVGKIESQAPPIGSPLPVISRIFY